MKYNFDHSPSCKGTWSIKWDQYGDEDIFALSNADMDFPVAKCITDKLTETARRGIFNYHLKPDTQIHRSPLLQNHHSDLNSSVSYLP